MNKIKFSHDYEKLPFSWEGTQAMLIGITYILDMEAFKRRCPQIIIQDTKFRGEEGYYNLNFLEGTLLTFFHFNSKKLFTTIRRYTENKYDYYYGELQECFELIRTEGK